MIRVSIIIPCRNEEEFITKCLDSIIGQDFPKEYNFWARFIELAGEINGQNPHYVAT